VSLDRVLLLIGLFLWVMLLLITVLVACFAMAAWLTDLAMELARWWSERRDPPEGP
jgi:hypothetical protein